MIGNYVDAAWASFDRNGLSAEAFWEPHFGARLCREIAKWLRDDGFRKAAVAGALDLLLFTKNSNSIPTTTWVILEIAKDPALMQAIPAEVATARVADPETGASTIDTDKLVALPLLQSVFTEVLRMHMDFDIIHHAKELIEIEGFAIPEGSMLQAPMLVPHYDENV